MGTSLHFLICFILVLLLATATGAQQSPKVSTVGILRIAAPGHLWRESFQKGLKEHGWVEGHNLLILDQWARGRHDRLPELAAELVKRKADVIVTAGPQATRAAKQATPTIPIVMTSDFAPVEDGIIASLAKPGGNVTGLSMRAGELSGKRLELLKETVPRVSRVAVLSNPNNRSHAHALDELKAAAKSLAVQLEFFSIKTPGEIESAFAKIRIGKSQALLVQADAMFNAQKDQIIVQANKNRLPSIFYANESVLSGGLMSYGVSLPDLYARAAVYVDKILKGTKPADLPVELPAKFELVINLKTAKQIALTVPPNVLVRADRVIR